MYCTQPSELFKGADFRGRTPPQLFGKLREDYGTERLCRRRQEVGEAVLEKEWGRLKFGLRWPVEGCYNEGRVTLVQLGDIIIFRESGFFKALTVLFTAMERGRYCVVKCS